MAFSLEVPGGLGPIGPPPTPPASALPPAAGFTTAQVGGNLASGLAGVLLGAAINGWNTAAVVQGIGLAISAAIPIVGPIIGLGFFLGDLLGGPVRAPDPFKPLRVIDGLLRDGATWDDPRIQAVARTFDMQRLGLCDADAYRLGFDFDDPEVKAATVQFSKPGTGSAAVKAAKANALLIELGFPLSVLAVTPPCDPISWAWHRHFYGDNSLSAAEWLRRADFIAGPKESTPTQVVGLGTSQPADIKLATIGSGVVDLTDVQGAPRRLGKRFGDELWTRFWAEFGPPGPGSARFGKNPLDAPPSFTSGRGKMVDPLGNLPLSRDSQFWVIPSTFLAKRDIPILNPPDAERVETSQVAVRLPRGVELPGSLLEPITITASEPAPTPPTAVRAAAVGGDPQVTPSDLAEAGAGSLRPINLLRRSRREARAGPAQPLRLTRRGRRGPLSRRTDPMATGFLEALGGFISPVLQSASQGLSGGLSTLIAQKIAGGGGGPTVVAAQPVAMPGGALVQPQTFGFPTGQPSFTGARRMATLSGRRGAAPVLQGQPAFVDVPFFDIAPQGAGALTDPFRVTASGNQVAKPFVTVRANGSAEWFIPAGKPTAWSKASVKRARRCRPR